MKLIDYQGRMTPERIEDNLVKMRGMTLRDGETPAYTPEQLQAYKEDQYRKIGQTQVSASVATPQDNLAASLAKAKSVPSGPSIGMDQGRIVRDVGAEQKEIAMQHRFAQPPAISQWATNSYGTMPDDFARNYAERRTVDLLQQAGYKPGTLQFVQKMDEIRRGINKPESQGILGPVNYQ
jgi:hypothetical protein